MIAWNKPNRPVILASNSPRRKKILSEMGVSFTVLSPNVDNEEDYLHVEKIKESIEHLALTKAESISYGHDHCLILGSDTLVLHDNKIIGKPSNREEAQSILQNLSGDIHQVYTAIAIINRETGYASKATAVTDVYFKELENREIEEYLNHEEYSDKAGAYAIQGKAMTFVKKINGCFYNVMGLPINETINLFQDYMNRVKGK